MPQPLRSTRLHAYLFRRCRPPPAVERETLTEVIALPQVRLFLHLLLSHPTMTIGGLLVGQFAGSRLMIHLATPGDPALPRASASPLTVDPRYAAGLADGLLASPGLDWVGMWVVQAHRKLDPAEDGEITILLAEARQLGLIDDDSVLLIAGWQAGRLAAVAYHVIDDLTVTVPVTFDHVSGGDPL